ncbi:hypothetical protein BMI91_19660 [Thioclava sediminum]|uniref:RNA polymerase sigma-70 region 2 domain-containing protein n=1 Tax=Thioclava sediminum TaxID=1915319 RepID=A0ABX3MSX2_9RHOB|nr:sigma-70 family RNA polymerase sigma factor [Thioclava sediminum]OOY22501.1 hypothetical protein BMI91_19660 [Thioclava sediminum]
MRPENFQTELWRQWTENGSEHARIALIESVEPMIKKMAGQFKQSGISVEDLKGAGMIGILEAIERFKPEQGKFSALVFFLARNEMFELMRSSSTPASMAKSRPDRNMRYRLGAIVSRLEGEGYSRSAALNAAAAELGITGADVSAAYTLSRSPASDIQDEEHRIGVDAVSVEDVHQASLRGLVEELLVDLPAIDQALMRQTIMSEDTVSLTALSKQMEISHQYLSSRRRNCLELLRKELKARGHSLDELIW